MVLEIDNIDTLQATIAEAVKADKIVLVDFYADWCPPCKMIAPKFAAWATEYEKSVTFVKVNVDKAAEVAEGFGISSMPTFMAMTHIDGELAVFTEIEGADEEEILDLLKNAAEGNFVGEKLKELLAQAGEMDFEEGEFDSDEDFDEDDSEIDEDASEDGQDDDEEDAQDE